MTSAPTTFGVISIRAIAKRYVPAEGADAYVDATIDQPRALIGVRLGGESRTTTWRMPVGEEDGTGIWHRRYYLEGTHMAALADRGAGLSEADPARPSPSAESA